ncbi:MAG: hypothetical protein ABJG86_18625 [Nitratireductor sp.]|uniref:Lipoprotein n=1 Tax=Nitratireductor arenosus TaxID=2682096 RepID=A0A844QCA3_9HYPH|nr:hypothetical protein [Nitratireductor arenosus]MVA95640.1 hypothetical protein [Nitratireductor arenosus]
MRQVIIALTLLAGFALSACSTATGGGRTQLTAEEVRSTFVGQPWRGPSGVFLFKRNGTYTHDFDRGGTYVGNYTIQASGVLKGETTNYTFFRNADGSYTYFHSRSGRYYPAKPGG